MVLVRKLRERLKTTARSLPVARHAWARYRRRRYEGRIRRFLDVGTGRADRLPMGAVYEATMRCNLHCEFCYVGDLLNLEGEWRQELTISGKVFFCPFIRVEVGDLTESSLEQVWNGERYVDMRRRLLEHGIFPVCRRCCKVELSPVPAVATADIPRRRAIPVTVVHT